MDVYEQGSEKEERVEIVDPRKTRQASEERHVSAHRFLNDNPPLPAQLHTLCLPCRHFLLLHADIVATLRRLDISIYFNRLEPLSRVLDRRVFLPSSLDPQFRVRRLL